ncbi:hypothetical protein OJAV_G00164790 [Oryzias javanicus]|uniref:Uncharacterized protein n=1 Tax=Oryzias javanicus TaxID=123683 RepID=A0A3S2PKB2_ORYJA|nr:hypothetical protein OJAV_G00164790 [Oryzias javanicus]
MLKDFILKGEIRAQRAPRPETALLHFRKGRDIFPLTEVPNRNPNGGKTSRTRRKASAGLTATVEFEAIGTSIAGTIPPDWQTRLLFQEGGPEVDQLYTLLGAESSMRGPGREPGEPEQMRRETQSVNFYERWTEWTQNVKPEVRPLSSRFHRLPLEGAVLLESGQRVSSGGWTDADLQDKHNLQV